MYCVRSAWILIRKLVASEARWPALTSPWPGKRGRPTPRSGKMATVAVVLLLCLAEQGLGAEGGHLLKASSTSGDLVRVTVAIEVGGDLKLNDAGKKVSRLPLKVTGNLLYDEKVIEAGGGTKGSVRTVRYYHQAEAEITIDKNENKSSLDDDSRLIVFESTAGREALFSPTGPLSREQLELVDVPGNSALVAGLLPDKRVKVGESWKHDTTTLARLLGLETVSKSGVKSSLREVAGGVAKLELSGKLSGAVGGVDTQLNLKAKYSFNLSRRRITWLAMSIGETRSIGHAAPGFEVVARLRMLISPLPEAGPLKDDALAGVPLRAKAGTALLAFESRAGGYQLLHDRRWRVISNQGNVTVMRLVDRGELVAQCNISRLPDLPAGKQVQLLELHQNIQKSLGKHFGQFVEASQAKTDAGLRVLRVVAEGVVSELPIRWTYYLFSNETGRRTAAVFTLEGRLIERFNEADQALVSGFQFLDRPQTDTEQPSTAARKQPAKTVVLPNPPTVKRRIRRR